MVTWRWCNPNNPIFQVDFSLHCWAFDFFLTIHSELSEVLSQQGSTASGVFGLWPNFGGSLLLNSLNAYRHAIYVQLVWMIMSFDISFCQMILSLGRPFKSIYCIAGPPTCTRKACSCLRWSRDGLCNCLWRTYKNVWCSQVWEG